MPWIAPKKKKWYLHWLVWTALTMFIAGWLAWPRVKTRYRTWRAKGRVEQAMKELNRGDYKRAIFMARTALEVLPMDAEVTGIMARGCEGIGAPVLAAQWRRRLDAIAPGDRDNIIAWASDLLKAGDATAAERTLAMLKPATQENAAYHIISAEIAVTKRDTATAEHHWSEAVRIEPSNESHRFQLASLQLDSKNPELRKSALESLTALSSKSRKNADALRMLLADARKRGDWPRAYECANTLLDDPAATFEDKLRKLETLRAINSIESASYLSDLHGEATSNPKNLYLLLMWMNQNNLPLMVSDWSRTMPPDVMRSLPVCIALADAYSRCLEWKRLREFAESFTWGEADYMRRAFYARALEKLGEEELSSGEWRNVVASARASDDASGRLERIVRLAIGWGWERRAQETMWIMANTPRCPKWMLNALWLIACENSNVSQLQKLAGILVQTDSKSPAYRNSYAFYSLLLRCEDGNPHREAEQLFKERPNDGSIAITRGLSLHQQGRSAEAAAVIESLPPEELEKPQVALYRTIFLTAAGKPAQAADFMKAAHSWKMLPEEKSLLERAKFAAANMEASNIRHVPQVTSNK